MCFAIQAAISLVVGFRLRKTVSDKMVLRSYWKCRLKSSCFPAPRWIRPGLAALFWFCVTQLVCGAGALEEAKFVIHKDAEFDMTYNDTVTSENQTIYAFNHTISRNKVSFLLYILEYGVQVMIWWFNCFLVPFFDFQTEGVRVTVDVLQQYLESPILFVIRQKQAVMSFQVPLILRGLWVILTFLSLFNVNSKMICFHQNKNDLKTVHSLRTSTLFTEIISVNNYVFRSYDRTL